MTRLTVVIPVFNDNSGLQRAVASALGVDPGVQVIIADDGSAPQFVRELDALADGWADRDVHVIHMPHAGPSAARNSGLQGAAGHYVMFLDSDDEFAAAARDIIAEALRVEDIGMVCGAVSVTGRTGRTCVFPAERPGAPGARLSELAGSFLVATDIARAIDGYDCALHYGENTDFVLRLAEECGRQRARIASTDEVLVVYHEQPHLRRHDLERLSSAVHLLERGRFDLDIPSQRAKLQAIAAVNACRVGRYSSAFEFALRALRSEPRNLRHLARLAFVCTGPFARRHWLRS